MVEVQRAGQGAVAVEEAKLPLSVVVDELGAGVAALGSDRQPASRCGPGRPNRACS